MNIQIKRNRTIWELQNDFSSAFPFLKLEFYRIANGRLGSMIRQKLIKTTSLGTTGNLKEGEIEITDIMTVGRLEKLFLEKFGMIVQVSRKSGTIWLETTMTDNWSLKQQNDHGRELSEPVPRILPDREMDYDQ
jgi:hypothetical protein